MGFQTKVRREYGAPEEVSRDVQATVTAPINAHRLRELAEFLKAAVEQGAVTPPSWLPKAGSPVEDFMQDTCHGLSIHYWTGMPVPDAAVNEDEVPHV
jgi:hypothetical protein